MICIQLQKVPHTYVPWSYHHQSYSLHGSHKHFMCHQRNCPKHTQNITATMAMVRVKLGGVSTKGSSSIMHFHPTAPLQAHFGNGNEYTKKTHLMNSTNIWKCNLTVLHHPW
jgi:hypothetical protein